LLLLYKSFQYVTAIKKIDQIVPCQHRAAKRTVSVILIASTGQEANTPFLRKIINTPSGTFHLTA
jgi:hypothetical protein